MRASPQSQLPALEENSKVPYQFGLRTIFICMAVLGIFLADLDAAKGLAPLACLSVVTILAVAFASSIMNWLSHFKSSDE